MAMAELRSSAILAAGGGGCDGLFRVERGVARVACRKGGIHPRFYGQAKVFCSGELVMVTGGTQPEYVVDVWSGNHHYYQGKDTSFLQDADRVERFNQRYGSLPSLLSVVPVLAEGQLAFQPKKKKQGAKGKPKK